MAARLGELLVRDRVLTPAQLQQALAYQHRFGGRLGGIVTKLGFCAETDVVQSLSRQYGVRAVDNTPLRPEAEALRLIPRETAQRFQLLPLAHHGGTLTVAMADPTNVLALDQIKFITGLRIEPAIAGESALEEALERCYASVELGGDPMGELRAAIELNDGGAEVEVQESEQQQELDLERAAEEAPVVRLVNAILTEAVARGASDIHVECYDLDVRIRYRVDGVLQEVMRLPLRLRDATVSRIKIMARLDISEKRLPQDGRIMLRFSRHGARKMLDLRVSILPTLFGEKVVMRLLDKDNLRLDMTRLGFEPESLRRFQAAIRQPYGMVLVTGPTGSGKTNTLYSSIAQLNTPQINIMTAEDPVEFQLTGINQVQVKEQIGLTFAAALRAFLRQDPNIIMVGEIRDIDTAEIAVKAALTGHLVLSTLHTNDAPSTLHRLINMGVEPFLVASSLILICAQRLVRRLCPECKLPAAPEPDQWREFGLNDAEIERASLYTAGGCPSCNQTGFRGRVGLYEVLTMDEELRAAVLAGEQVATIRRMAIDGGMITLRRSGAAKVLAGVTSIEEVLRETVA